MLMLSCVVTVLYGAANEWQWWCVDGACVRLNARTTITNFH